MLQPPNPRARAHRIPFGAPPYHFELGPIRPPSEGSDRSLLLRVNRNCPWNRCLFCRTYKGSRFEYRALGEVEGDIAVAETMTHGLKAASWALGLGGRITQEVFNSVLRGTPEIQAANQEERLAILQSLSTVANWLASGGRTVFLQDANAVIMRVPELLALLSRIRQSFPSVERITSYARSKTIMQRAIDQLALLREAGLNRLHVGLESGCDDVLAFMQKGVTGAEHAAAGHRVKEAGITLSEYYMPGLGGRRWSHAHAVGSARVLSAVNPDFIRLRSLMVRAGSGLEHTLASGEFEELDEEEMVDEIALFVDQLDCQAMLVSDQMSNLLPEIEGQLPGDKGKMLSTIAHFRALLPLERLSLRLQRRLNSYLAVYGALTGDLEGQVEAAIQAIEQEAPGARPLVERAIAVLKQGFV